ncbi:MAG TPA: PilZ domain-containing protein, partial [Desulfuromonadales bacterium]|nr:PilZ domain-containing protein [Desulfuromonadales bacterium]
LDSPLREGTEVQISFKLPGQDNPPIEAVAKVVWTNLDDRRAKPDFPQGNGMEFTRLDPQGLERIRSFVAPPQEGELLH